MKQFELGSLWNLKACLVSWLEMHFCKKKSACVGKNPDRGRASLTISWYSLKQFLQKWPWGSCEPYYVSTIPHPFTSRDGVSAMSYLPLRWTTCTMQMKGHLSWAFYFLYMLGIGNSHIINYYISFNIIRVIKSNRYLVAKFKHSRSLFASALGSWWRLHVAHTLVPCAFSRLVDLRIWCSIQ